MSLALTISAAIFFLTAIALAGILIVSSPLWIWAVPEPDDPTSIEAGEPQEEEEVDS